MVEQFVKRKRRGEAKVISSGLQPHHEYCLESGAEFCACDIENSSRAIELKKYIKGQFVRRQSLCCGNHHASRGWFYSRPNVKVYFNAMQMEMKMQIARREMCELKF